MDRTLAANMTLQCDRPNCERLRHYGWKLCETHAHEVIEKRANAALKATATKRERYPHKYYAPGERTDWQWQALAQQFVARAKRAGILPDLSRGEYACADCGGVACEYDHRDYSRPLDVEPVCRACNLNRGRAIWPSASRYDFARLANDGEGR